MSFQEERSDISICNKALSRIKQQPLSGSLTDPANLNKHAARECNLWYKTVVRQVLTSHHWGLATVRTLLAQEATNDRPGEWMYAYVPPSDMAFPVSVGPDLSATSTISYYAGLNYILATLNGRPVFRFEKGVLFSNEPNAALDYVSFNITEQDFNEAVEGLVVLFLAAQLARSVAKDDKLAESLHNEGLNKMNIEIAQNLNLMGQTYGSVYITDAERARDGYDPRFAALVSRY